jgi:hypothetical protein
MAVWDPAHAAFEDHAARLDVLAKCVGYVRTVAEAGEAPLKAWFVKPVLADWLLSGTEVIQTSHVRGGGGGPRPPPGVTPSL